MSNPKGCSQEIHFALDLSAIEAANFLKSGLVLYVQYYYFCTDNKTAMDTKLTIKLDNEVISRAKKYAQNRRTSLSKMIESFLVSVTQDESDDIEITPLVKSLSGVIRLPESFDYKKERTDFLIKKYS